MPKKHCEKETEKKSKKKDLGFKCAKCGAKAEQDKQLCKPLKRK
jgi:ribosomal protein L44E